MKLCLIVVIQDFRYPSSALICLGLVFSPDSPSTSAILISCSQNRRPTGISYAALSSFSPSIIMLQFSSTTLLQTPLVVVKPLVASASLHMYSIRRAVDIIYVSDLDLGPFRSVHSTIRSGILTIYFRKSLFSTPSTS